MQLNREMTESLRVSMPLNMCAIQPAVLYLGQQCLGPVSLLWQVLLAKLQCWCAFWLGCRLLLLRRLAWLRRLWPRLPHLTLSVLRPLRYQTHVAFRSSFWMRVTWATWLSQLIWSWEHNISLILVLALTVCCSDILLSFPLQVYYPDQYGGYVPQPPPHGTQMVYSADGQYYTVAYPYQYQGMV